MMRPVALLIVILTALAIVGTARAEVGGLSSEQRQRLEQIVKTAELRAAKDPVRAFLALREAYRLEQLWTNNTFDGSAISETAIEAFTQRLMAADGGALMRILKSPQILTNDKLNLLRRLEQEVILSYPGRTWESERP